LYKAVELSLKQKLALNSCDLLAEHMKSAFNLLPTNKYFGIVDDPVVVFDETSALTKIFRAKYGNQISDAGTLRAFLNGHEGRKKPEIKDVNLPNVLLAPFLEASAITYCAPI